jgi:hypothetical protein
MKGFQIHVEPQNLSEADKLNGLEWKGITNITAAAYHTYGPRIGWEKWRTGLGTDNWDVVITKNRGSWSAFPKRNMDINKTTKLECQDIPPEIGD